LSIGIGLNRPLGDDFHWWYNGVDNDSPIHRVTLLSRYNDKMAPKGTDSLLIEIPEPIETPFDLQQTHILDLLKEAKFPHHIEDRDVETIAVLRTKGYPIPSIGHRAKVAWARDKLVDVGVYLAGRWGAHEYLNLDHIIKGAESVAQAIMFGPSDDYYWSNWYYNEKED
jgi:protoporphyrinogen oxidase